MPRLDASRRAMTMVTVVVVSIFCLPNSSVFTQSPPPGPWAATDLGTLGGPSASALAVSDLALNTVGSSTTASGATHAFRRNMISGMLDLGTLGGTNSEAFAIASDIVGRAQVATGKYHACRWTIVPSTGGITRTDLGTLGGSESEARSINNWGVVVGSSYTTGDASTDAFIYQNGAMSPLGASLGGTNSWAAAVNDGGHVAGFATLPNSTTKHAFLYTGGSTIDLGTPRGSSRATSINERDEVAGYWEDTGAAGAFLYTGGVRRELPGLGGAFAYALSVNENADVVGEAQTSAGVRHAVLWRQGSVTDLNTLIDSSTGWVLQSATSIDDYGNIVGNGTRNGQQRAFLLTPPIDLALSLNRHENQTDTNIPNPHEAGGVLDLGATVRFATDVPHWATGIVVTQRVSGPVQILSWDTRNDCTLEGQALTCRVAPIGPGGLGRDVMFRARSTAAGDITHTASVVAEQSDPDLSNNSGTESNRAVSLAAFTVGSPVVGGSPAAAEATLTSAAPSGGAAIKITSSNPAVAIVPSNFGVAGGSLSKGFWVSTTPVAQDIVVQISATYGLATITRNLTILASAPSTPYGGTARAVPGTIQAEDFDAGGEGVAYHDNDSPNMGGSYRSDAVDIEGTADAGGGYNVGWIGVGEWMKYTVNVAAAGTYTLEARVASPGGGGTFHVESNGSDKTGPITIPNTGAWQAWTTVSRSVTLSAGAQVLRVVFDSAGSSGAVANLNYLRLTASTTGSTPYGGTARAVPGTIQAEDYDVGGEGVAYHDTDAANVGGSYRTGGVDIEGTGDSGGGFNVGWIGVGEWLKYSVNVAAAGSYTLEARVASPGGGATFHVEANGVDKTGPMTVTNTGAWQSWATVSKTVTLTAGAQVLRVVFDSAGGSGAVANLNYLRLTATGGGGSTPFGGTARALPGVVQAEDFDEGGEAVAYHDSTAGNSGGAYRSTNVDIEGTSDAGGGFDVGWMTAGEWLQYTVNVASAGSYALSVRAAASGAGGTFHLEANGANVSGALTIPNTGGWQNWTTVTGTVTLSAGTQVLRLVLDTNGSTGVFGNINSFSFTSASAPPEVVLYASDLTLHGAWFTQADSTAAEGQKVLTPDAGWSTANAPLASPADYFEATFDAPAGIPYAVWLRLRATGDTKYSESVWVQFSDARVAGGTAYLLGSASGLLVNLEPCANCGVSNWGWQNGAYWVSQASTVTFAAGGRHTVRIQVREDGAQIDQVVLSPSRYLLAAPGPVRNDSTIVPK